jgi:excisionase family DNA binding protein
MATVADREQTTKGELIGEGFVGVEDAMEFLGLCRASIYKHMDAGELAYAKFGRSRRIPKRALHEFAAKALVVA